MSEHKRLPIGMQTFSELIETNCYYVDKTQYIQQLIESPGKFKFLSRPRRFGKSLLLSTMNALFSGKKKLFEGLAIYDTWNWNNTYPILHFDLSGANVTSSHDLRRHLAGVLKGIAYQHKVTLTDRFDYSLSLEEIIIQSVENNKGPKKVVILVDEYDDPISSNRSKPALAEELRDEMRGFYKNFKRLDQYVHFGFLTGVTKFSHLNLFSGLNNLKDITLDPNYSAICGYTEKELIDTFAAELQNIPIEELRHWYNGYSWDGTTRLYNPHDSLSAFDDKECRGYWIDTGSTKSLIDQLDADTPLLQSFIQNFTNISFSNDIIDSVDIDSPNIYSLLFQTGYLTIRSISQTHRGSRKYHLKIPNHEVDAALSKILLSYITKIPIKPEAPLIEDISEALFYNNFERLIAQLHSLYASIPHDAYRKNKMYTYEGFYAITFLFLMRAVADLYVYPEDPSATGRADITVLYNNSYYIFEFKVVDDTAKKIALQQIVEKDYPAKYRAEGKPIYLIGIEFSKKTRTIVWYDVKEDK